MSTAHEFLQTQVREMSLEEAMLVAAGIVVIVSTQTGQPLEFVSLRVLRLAKEIIVDGVAKN
jgi:hypothetical protein